MKPFVLKYSNYSLLRKLLLSVFLLFFTQVAFAKEIGIVVVALYGIETAEKEWKPTVDYLNEKIPEHSFKIIAHLPKDLESIKNAVQNEEANFIIAQPAIYVDLEMSLGASRMLTLVDKKGFSEFGSVLLVKETSPYQQISDLKGKTIAGVGPMGFGGWLIGLKEMLDLGFDPRTDAKEIVYLGSQRKEVEAVYDGDVDLAVIRTGTLEKLESEGEVDIKDFRVLHSKSTENFPLLRSSSLYPEWCFAKADHTSDTLAKSVALHLLQLEAHHPVNQAAHFQEWVSPYSYKPVHELLRELKVGPYEDYGEISYEMFFKQHGFELSLLMFALFSTIILYQVKTNHNLKEETDEKEKALQEKEAALKQLEQIAHYDSLTGLANRHLSMIILEQMIHRSIRHKETMVVCFIDLDAFKAINDNYGHNMGDEVLRRVAKILQSTLRKVDVVGRLGGDEFLVVAEEVSDIQKFKERLEYIIVEIKNIGKELRLDLPFGASIGGIYGIPKNYSNTELISLSDELMYQVKREGKGYLLLKPIPKARSRQKTLFGRTLY